MVSIIIPKIHTIRTDTTVATLKEKELGSELQRNSCNDDAHVTLKRKVRICVRPEVMHSNQASV